MFSAEIAYIEDIDIFIAFSWFCILLKDLLPKNDFFSNIFQSYFPITGLNKTLFSLCRASEMAHQAKVLTDEA